MSVHRRCRKDSQLCQSPRDKNPKEGCARCSEDKRGHSEHDEGAQVSRRKPRKPARQRIQMRQYASSPSQDESGHERPQGTAEGASIAPRQASPPAAPPSPPSPGRTSVREPTEVR